MVPIFFLTIENEDDREFIKQLYENYYPIMKKKAYLILNDSYIADEAIHEAFIKLMDKIKTLRSLSPPQRTVYIVYTIKHISINLRKKQSSQSKKMYFGMSDDLMILMPDESFSTEEIVLKQETNQELRESIEELSERDRDLLYYKYFLDLTDQEISTAMNIPVNNIRQYLTRARRRVLIIVRGGK